jgi:exopolysaccharide production protein ExoY
VTLPSWGIVPLPHRCLVDAHLRGKDLELRIKRWVDVLVAGPLLIILGPLMLLIAAAIRRESCGPALFAQARWGLRGSTFLCYKFRTMHVGAGAACASTPGVGREGHLAKSANDSRVTRLGRILRRTSLDELPQLWNVLVGDMSLVGPRPLMVHMLAPYPEVRDVRCRLRPGITGLWQVSARANNTHIDSMLAYDLEYLQRVGLRFDIWILARTVRAVIRGDGAV